ncbi:MAG: FAD-dependent oxidoreductase, partial [Planctomycetia bacterium]
DRGRGAVVPTDEQPGGHRRPRRPATAGGRRFVGQSAHAWRHLKTGRLDHALPDESPAARRGRPAGAAVAPGLFVCGDHCTTASINGALASGRACAEAVLALE